MDAPSVRLPSKKIVADPPAVALEAARKGEVRICTSRGVARLGCRRRAVCATTTLICGRRLNSISACRLRSVVLTYVSLSCLCTAEPVWRSQFLTMHAKCEQAQTAYALLSLFAFAARDSMS